MKKLTVKENFAASVLLRIAGGGYTTEQTAKAVEWQRKLFEEGELTIEGKLEGEGFHISLQK